jgi:small-conductance mechanosensitive channel
MDTQTIVAQLQTYLVSLSVAAGAVAAGFLLALLLFALLKHLSKQTPSVLDESLVKHAAKPARLIIPLLFLELVLPFLKISPGERDFVRHALSILLIFSVAWLLMRMSKVVEDIIVHRYRRDVPDNLAARKVYTQLRIFKRILLVVVSVLALAAILMTFERVRQVGTSILASAGILGIIIGFAAQRTLGNLLASIQIALAEPFRIDDVVIVENEWGWIEEINITYVVVRIWDLRRLILPISYFTEKPFQNWTRVTADLLGTVYLYVDYTVPIEEIRSELRRILDNSKDWDSKAWNLQVTDATEHTVQLRALVSAADSSAAWNLRCEVREKLIQFIQKNYPNSLPKTRAEITPTDSTAGSPPLAFTT